MKKLETVKDGSSYRTLLILGIKKAGHNRLELGTPVPRQFPRYWKVQWGTNLL